MTRWFTGSGNEVEFEEILKQIREHAKNGGIVYLGTDSFLNKDRCTFSTALVLHGASGQSGGKYFINRNNSHKGPYNVLVARITEETNRSVQLGLKLMGLCPNIKIEIHLDVSASDKKAGTSHLSDMLVGYAKGAGFETKIKPDAFAAASIADKHSK
jgi:predicted RNase H-related nuclease YkuK (DUF458 family)